MKWRPLKWFCDGPPQYGLNIAATQYSPFGLRFIRTTDITPNGELSAPESGVFVNDDEAGDHDLTHGDLLFSRSGSLGRCLRYQSHHGPATFAGYLVRFRPLPSESSRYLAYCAQAAFFQGAIAADAISSTIANFNAERYANLIVPWWPGERQRAIADFLDIECSRIGRLVDRKSEILALLSERRESSINATTFGSGPHIRVRHISSRVTSGPRGWAQFVAATGTPFLRIANIQRHNIELDMSNIEFIDAPPTAEARRTEVRAGDVLISITADIGSVGIVRQPHAGSYVSQHVALVSPTGCSSDWLAFAISSAAAQAQLDSGQYGGTKTQLSLGDIGDLRVPLPSAERQRELVRQLHEVIAITVKARTLLTQQIALLMERRQALITAAVTGHLDRIGGSWT